MVHHEREGNIEKAKVSCAEGLFTGSFLFTEKYLFTSLTTPLRRAIFTFAAAHSALGLETLNCIEEGGRFSLGQVDVQLPVVVRPLHVLPLYQALEKCVYR